MALPKRVKVGGAYIKGYALTVNSASGNYSTVITNASGAAINGLSITPDSYGANDKIAVYHYDDAAGTGNIMAILAEDINNHGANSSILIDFSAMELVDSGQCLKVIYTNTASIAMNVYVIADWVGIKKTS